MNRGKRGCHRSKLAMVCTAGLMAFVLTAIIAPASGWAQTLHGAGSLKSCTPCKLPGENTSCFFRVVNIDEFGDILRVNSSSDTYTTDSGGVTIPASGNLPITAVNCGPTAGTPPPCSGASGTTCTVGGALPCNIGPGGNVTFGSVFTIPASETGNLPDAATAGVTDLCTSGDVTCPTQDVPTTFNSN